MQDINKSEMRENSNCKHKKFVSRFKRFALRPRLHHNEGFSLYSDLARPLGATTPINSFKNSRTRKSLTGSRKNTLLRTRKLVGGLNFLKHSIQRKELVIKTLDHKQFFLQTLTYRIDKK